MPKFETTITLGNVLSIGSIIIAVVTTIVTIQGAVNYQSRAIDTITSQVREVQTQNQDLKIQVTRLEEQVRMLTRELRR